MGEDTKVVVQVRKRDGSIALFSKQKIMLAISKAMDAVDQLDLGEAADLCDQATELINKKFGDTIPSVERLQDIVEEVLMKSGHVKVAKAYILYRFQRTQLREAKRALLHGAIEQEVDFSLNALQILENRYLLRNEQGVVIERPSEMFGRVANHIAQAETTFKNDPKPMRDQFYSILAKKYFFPTSPIMMNSGTKNKQLLSCYAIPIEDSLESIFDALKYGAIVQQSGGGTGFAFSNVRPKRDPIKHIAGVSSGPLAFMGLFEQSMKTIKQGGRRDGANMGILRVDHPDILDFINLKADGKTLSNFNLSIGITEAFMRAVKAGTNYSLINPRTNQGIAMVPARVVFNNIIAMAWRRGDPGVIFLDRINKRHSCQHLGKIQSTSPCAEIPLLPFESAAEGSINLTAMIDDDNVFNWQRFKTTIHTAVRFLDNAIEINEYPLKQAEQAGQATRKIGLGIIGFADLLYRLGVKYDSQQGLLWAKKIMSFLQKESHAASEKLAFQRGSFKAWKGSSFQKNKKRMRNATLTAILPTGTMSLLAEASPSLEPNFALSYKRKALDGRELIVANPYFKKVLKEHGLYSESLLREISMRGGIQQMMELPKKLRDVFVTAQDISAEYHIKMQAAFQEFTDNAISKTINFDSAATVKDVEEGFLLAWDLGCKGITMYRDGSMDSQIISLQKIITKKRKDKK